MRTVLLSLAVVFAVAGRLPAHGLLIPEDRQLPPLAMVHHRVKIDIQDQVAVTEVEQTFRNHTDRPLEATYVFPVPRGASAQVLPRFAAFFHAMLDAGVYLPPSAFEAWFVSAAIDDDALGELEAALAPAARAAAAVQN